jgi:Flp pilus assembly protein TadG
MKPPAGTAMKLNQQPRLAMRRFLRGTEGILAVEAAVMTSVFFLCLCGIVDFGNIYVNWHVVCEAAREGARLAAISTANGGSGTTQSAVQTSIRSKYNNNRFSLTMTPSTVSSGSGQSITVQVSETVNILTPLIKPFFDHDPAVQGQCTMLSQ